MIVGKSMNQRKTVYTLGHSSHSIDHFIELLRRCQIQRVADVRSLPFSRFYPQFNRDRLNKALQKTNILYSFEGEFIGGRINDPGCYKERVLPNRKNHIAELINYDELLQRSWFNQGIQRLIDYIDVHSTAILCSEEDPSRCHRSLLVGRRMAELGYAVGHIRANGRIDWVEFECQIPIFD